MAYFIVLVILLTFFVTSAAKTEDCERYATTGIRLTLSEFVYEKFSSAEKVVWLHNNTVIYQQEKGKRTVGKPDDVTSKGSLQLKNLQLTSSGLYQAQVYNTSGAVINQYSCFLWVMEKVPKPALSYNCGQQSVHFNCQLVKAQNLRYSWKMDEKILTGEERSTLTIALSKLKSENSITCTVYNQVSNGISDTVFPTCASKSPSSQYQLCFQPKTLMAVVLGAGGVLIILVIVIIVLCCRWRQSKSPKCREKQQPRMLSLTQRETDYETMHTPEHPQEPSPKLSPRADRHKTINEPEAAGGSLQLPGISTGTPKQGQDPSPVPKPRTRRPNTPDI